MPRRATRRRANPMGALPAGAVRERQPEERHGHRRQSESHCFIHSDQAYPTAADPTLSCADKSRFLTRERREAPYELSIDARLHRRIEQLSPNSPKRSEPERGQEPVHPCPIRTHATVPPSGVSTHAWVWRCWRRCWLARRVVVSTRRDPGEACGSAFCTRCECLAPPFIDLGCVAS